MAENAPSNRQQTSGRKRTVPPALNHVVAGFVMQLPTNDRFPTGIAIKIAYTDHECIHETKHTYCSRFLLTKLIGLVDEAYQ
jgi:hypothetical protein